MPEAIFVVHLDDYQGFIVEKRYPSTLSLNEKALNLVYYEHEKEKATNLKFSDIDGMRVVSFAERKHPGWVVCFVLEADEDYETEDNNMAGMARLILELMSEVPDTVNLREILSNESILNEPNEEQRMADIFFTPSSALLLERLEIEGVERAAKLSIWLQSQLQTDTIELREIVEPLMKSGVVKVEMLGKTGETVFLIKDIYGYRAPPVKSIMKAMEANPEMGQKYKQIVSSFFSPPTGKGYNPTLPVDDPNSPLLEDREKMSRLLSKSLHYMVLECLREGPQEIGNISQKTALPLEIVQSILWSFESDRVAAQLDEYGIWVLVSDPVIESFMPEFILPTISKKLSDKELAPETAIRHLELLIEEWGEICD
jgi:hypothetical protein